MRVNRPSLRERDLRERLIWEMESMLFLVLKRERELLLDRLRGVVLLLERLDLSALRLFALSIRMYFSWEDLSQSESRK